MLYLLQTIIIVREAILLCYFDLEYCFSTTYILFVKFYHETSLFLLLCSINDIFAVPHRKGGQVDFVILYIVCFIFLTYTFKNLDPVFCIFHIEDEIHYLLPATFWYRILKSINV